MATALANWATPGSDAIAPFVLGMVEVEYEDTGFWSSHYTRMASDSFTITYDLRFGENKRGQISPPGTPGYWIGGEESEKRTMTAIRHRPKMNFSGAAMSYLRKLGTERNPVGMSIVQDGIRTMTGYDRRLIEYVCAMRMISPDTFNVTTDKGTTIAVTSDIPAAQYATSYSSAAWETAGTDLAALMRTAALGVEDTWGIYPDTVRMNPTTFDDTFAKNTDVLKWIAANPNASYEWMNTGRISKYKGFNIDVREERYDTAAIGSAKSTGYLIPDNTILLQPQDLRRLDPIIWECKGEDIEGGMNSYGIFVKTWEEKDPSGIVALLNHAWGAAIRIPAMYVWK